MSEDLLDHWPLLDGRTNTATVFQDRGLMFSGSYKDRHPTAATSTG